MPDITAQMIKTLRDRTGVGMGKCKEALQEANGDIEEAINILRKAGIASAVKKEGRTTNEGMIGFAAAEDAVAIVEINAETDFVVKNEHFKDFLATIAREAAVSQPSSLEAFLAQPYTKDPSLTIDQYRATLVQKIGENIQISRVLCSPKSSQKSIGVYSHLGGKIVTMVEIAGGNSAEELAKDIAMHVAAASPDFLSPDAVPADVIAREKEVVKAQIQNKPDHIIEKIIEGKLRAFYEENCLLCQPYIRDDATTIQQLVEKKVKETGESLSISTFVHWTIGQN